MLKKLKKILSAQKITKKPLPLLSSSIVSLSYLLTTPLSLSPIPPIGSLFTATISFTMAADIKSSLLDKKYVLELKNQKFTKLALKKKIVFYRFLFFTGNLILYLGDLNFLTFFFSNACYYNYFYICKSKHFFFKGILSVFQVGFLAMVGAVQGLEVSFMDFNGLLGLGFFFFYYLGIYTGFYVDFKSGKFLEFRESYYGWWDSVKKIIGFK